MSRRKFPNSWKSLLHFNYPYPGETGDGLRDEIGFESWSRSGEVKFVGTEQPVDQAVLNTPKYGYRCPQFNVAGGGVYVVATNSSGIFNLSSNNSYEISFFVRFEDSTAGDIFSINDLEGALLKLTKGTSNKLSLVSTPLGVSENGATSLTTSVWHHVLIRLSGGSISVYLNGTQEITADVTADVVFSADNAKLGGFTGQLDEFLFRHAAGTGSPSVPTGPHQASLKTNAFGGPGSGKHGTVSYASGEHIINTHAIVSGISGTQVIIGTQTAGEFGNFEAGDEIMIHQSLKQSASSATEADLGAYSIRNIVGISGSVITLDRAIDEFSPNTGNYRIQAIKIPNFIDFTVEEGATIVPLMWSESTGGGIVAFKCKNNLILNGRIITLGRGPARTDSLALTHAQIVDNFVLTGNAFIVCGNMLATGPNARIGNPWDGSGKGGSGGIKGGSSGQDGENGGVGNGGAGGYGYYVNGSTSNAIGGTAGKNGAGGNGGGSNGGYPGSPGRMGAIYSPNLILIAKSVNAGASAISTGGVGGSGGGGGGTANSISSGGGGGGGGGNGSGGDGGRGGNQSDGTGSAGGGGGGGSGGDGNIGDKGSYQIGGNGGTGGDFGLNSSGVGHKGGDGGPGGATQGLGGIGASTSAGTGYGGGGGGGGSGGRVGGGGGGGGGNGTGFCYIACQS